MVARLVQVRDNWFRRQEYRVDGEARPRLLKWTLLTTRYFSIFFHKYYGPDWTRDPHNHPTDFLSIGLMGSYVETVYDASGAALYNRTWRAPWVRTFPRTHIHRTSSVGPRGAYTICIVNRWNQDWGFVIDGKLTPWRDYIRFFRSKRSDRMPPSATVRPQKTG
jgi:hypothetical protein